MVNENGFIKFYNVFMENGENKLSPHEWSIYSPIAARWNPFLNVSEISISRLTEIQSIFKNKKNSVNRESVKDRVYDLHSRGIITILNINDQFYTGVRSEYNYNKTLIILLNNFDGKFQQIPRRIYEYSIDAYENYSICCIYRFEEYYKSKKLSLGFEKSFDGWSILLNCGKDKARRILKSMVDNKMIRREGWSKNQSIDTGQYDSSPYQYFICDVQEKVDIKELELVDDEKLEFIGVVDKFDPEIFYIKDEVVVLRKLEYDKLELGNWEDWGTWLTEDDFCLYYSQMDRSDKFKKLCDKRIKAVGEDNVKEKMVDGKNLYLKQLDRVKETYLNKEKNIVVNAVEFKGEKRIAHLNKDNIDKVDWSQVDKIYYHQLVKDDNESDNEREEYTIGVSEFKNLASEENIKLAIKEYIKLVKSERKLTIDELVKLRNKIGDTK